MANTEIMIWSGFNLILSAMAIGGIFTIPSIKGFCIAMFAAILSAFFTVAIQNFMIIFGLSVITIPCLLTNYIIIIALEKRKKNQNPILNLISPKLPETSLHKLKISKLRKANKISLAMPVYGMWDIYQGFDGKYTHKGDWRYAVDFYITKNSQSFKNNGQNLKDYYCFINLFYLLYMEKYLQLKIALSIIPLAKWILIIIGAIILLYISILQVILL